MGSSLVLIEAVAISNLSAIASQSAMLSNLAFSNTVTVLNLSMQNAVAHQQAMSQLRVAILGRAVNVTSNLHPVESRSASEVLFGSAIAEALAGLKAAIRELLTRADSLDF
jgi:hypothetical protein